VRVTMRDGRIIYGRTSWASPSATRGAIARTSHDRDGDVLRRWRRCEAYGFGGTIQRVRRRGAQRRRLNANLANPLSHSYWQVPRTAAVRPGSRFERTPQASPILRVPSQRLWRPR